MPTDDRLNEMVSLVEQSGFLSVKELSQTFEVSEVTVRRDLQRLHDDQRLLRTYGGAAPLSGAGSPTLSQPDPSESTLESILIDQVDVLIATSIGKHYDAILVDRAENRNIPIIAESLAMDGMTTMVAVDNYQAGWSLGQWAGQYARQNFSGKAQTLDLTYHLENTRDRSSGFIAGLQNELPDAEIALSINTQADQQSAYQLVTDAIQVYPEINIIFCINDTIACRAIQACRDLGVVHENMLILTFGLEGNTLLDEMLRKEYLKAGLAMFPEIVGPVCIEAAISAHNHVEMPRQFVTPHAVLTADSVANMYEKKGEDWRLNWGQARSILKVPLDGNSDKAIKLPHKIGFVIRFSKHEWYQNMVAAMKAHTNRLGIELKIIDADQNLRDELIVRKLGIAQMASDLVNPGDVVLIDGGQVTTYLAEALVEKSDITVITNSLSVFDALRDKPTISLILAGGLLRNESQTLIGPTAETVFRELRADKLFLAVTGVSLDFGLSHTNLAEVTVKQAMLRAAREIILLADHTKFEQESVVQVASVDVVDKLITDNALSASTRLDLTQLEIEVIMVKT